MPKDSVSGQGLLDGWMGFTEYVSGRGLLRVYMHGYDLLGT